MIEILHESQGQNLALTALYLPCSLDRGCLSIFGLTTLVGLGSLLALKWTGCTANPLRRLVRQRLDASPSGRRYDLLRVLDQPGIQGLPVEQRQLQLPMALHKVFFFRPLIMAMRIFPDFLIIV